MSFSNPPKAFSNLEKFSIVERCFMIPGKVFLRVFQGKLTIYVPFFASRIGDFVEHVLRVADCIQSRPGKSRMAATSQSGTEETGIHSPGVPYQLPGIFRLDSLSNLLLINLICKKSFFS